MNISCQVDLFWTPVSLPLTFYTLAPDAYSPYCSIYLSQVAYKENLFYNQECLQSAIISFFLMTLMFDLRVIF